MDTPDNQQVLLVRIDERLASLQERFSGFETRLADNYVTKDEFTPVKQVVYSTVGFVLLSVAGAIVALIIKQ